MLFLFSLLALLSLTATVASSPALQAKGTKTNTAAASTPTSCNAKIFEQPWVLGNITIYTPAASERGSTPPGVINFLFCDENHRLRLNTKCSGQVVDNTCEGEDGAYVSCEDPRVGFKLYTDLIMMERGYKDHCLGPWPYNFGTAFGENNTTMKITMDPSGTLATQKRLLVNITALM